MGWETELVRSFEAIVHRDFPNPHRIGCQDAIHSLVWRLALGTLNPPLSSLISGSAALASMSLRNSAEKQSPESVAQQECGTCHLLT